MTDDIENIPYPKKPRGIPSSCAEFCRWAAKQDVDHCIEWPLKLTPAGYGRVRFEGRRTSAHRIVLELAKGPPPDPSYFAAHAPIICHNPACVNPNHLRWATPAENNADMKIDGTLGGDRSSSRHTGVSQYASGKWRAYVYVGPLGKKKQKHLGVFDTQEEALSAVTNFGGQS